MDFNLGHIDPALGAIVEGGSGGDPLDALDPWDLTGRRARDAAINSQTRGVVQGNKHLEGMYLQSREDLNPYLNIGQLGLGRLTDGINDMTSSFTMADFQKDPGYQFRMQEGMNALEGSAAARGSLNSGATMKALQRYGQNFASNEYQNAYSRFNADRDQRFNKLSTLAGIGQTATGQALGVNQNYGNRVSDNFVGLGNAEAAAHIGQQNATAGAAGQAASVLGLAFSDRRLKKNIKPISKEDLTELRKSLKPYMYEYVSDSYGKGEWVGVMAQDLEKSKLGKTCVIENDRGEKMVDMTKLMSLMVASMCEEVA